MLLIFCSGEYDNILCLDTILLERRKLAPADELPGLLFLFLLLKRWYPKIGVGMHHQIYLDAIVNTLQYNVKNLMLAVMTYLVNRQLYSNEHNNLTYPLTILRCIKLKW